ncbi:kinase-like domain-containing protein [Aspergillus avenaceus]|uniref:Kinase-like domain-containing protein n=1 Tax=Aspergillus avenaceus TaxID=36643 RepID=A0A5N6TQU8_ASPAV|nr:kinase-like domain-containing protein [Aspergillus avenaceus]
MASERVLVGPYEVLVWPDRLGSVGVARHDVTFEQFPVKTESVTSLSHEARILHTVSGGIGMPLLHWFGAVDGTDIMVIDSYGSCLEETFCQSGRYFSLQMLLCLAEQLLSRVEFIHSRNIIHGNLSPWSFALGSLDWQNRQVFLVDFNTVVASKTTAHGDLYAIAQILSYFYRGGDSWEKHQQKPRCGIDKESPPVLIDFFREISLCKEKSPNYDDLKDIFRAALQDMATQLAIALDLKGPRNITSELLPKIEVFQAMTSGSLFDTLNLKLSQAGQGMEKPIATLPRRNLLGLLELFDDILRIYMVLLLRDRLSCQKVPQVLRAYHLPNKLWRDLYWFLNSIGDEGDGLSNSFKCAFTERAYKYISTLYESFPCYQPYWTELLLALACRMHGLGSEYDKLVWTQNVFYWKGQIKGAKAQCEVSKISVSGSSF